MTPEQAAEARRRKKEELERQLAALDEEDRYYSRASQPPDLHRHREHAVYNNPPSSSSYPSRNDVIPPPWPQAPTSASSSNVWRGGPVPTASSASGHSQRLPVQSSFQPMTEPTPIHSGSGSSSQTPWSRTRIPSLASSNPTGSSSTNTPPPHGSSRQPRMPNPFSPTFINIPVPSKEQVEVYLIRAQGQPLGLSTGWTINNHSFDVYNLFLAITRLGGSKAVTRRQWWPDMAGIMGIPGVNTPHGPDMEKSGHQLHTFFMTHLGALEEMWEKTSGTAEDAGASYADSVDSHSRSHLLRIPQAVSSARSGHEEEIGPSFARTYPPQPPPPREPPTSASGNGSRSAGRSIQASSSRSQKPGKQRQPAQTSSVPLHVNPVDISTRRTTDCQSTHQPMSSSYGQSQPQPYQSEHHYPSSQPQHITSAQFTSISPTLHHPAPSSLPPGRMHDRLDQHPSALTHDTTTPATGASSQHVDHRTSGATQPADQAGPSNTTRPPPSGSGKSTAPSFPALGGYTPPKFASFDHLVQTNALKLPKLPPNVHLDYVGSPFEIFAKRCFELRSVVKKIQAKQPTRHISPEEMMFWQKLLAILRHNPQVIIPGHHGDTPMTTDNAPLPVATVANGQSTVAGPSGSATQPTTDGQAPAEPVKRKRNRQSKASQGDSTDSAVPKKKGRKRKMPNFLSEPALEPIANSSTLPDLEPSAGPSTGPIFAIDTAASMPTPMVRPEPSAGPSTAPIFALDTAASMPTPVVPHAVTAVDPTAAAAAPSIGATDNGKGPSYRKVKTNPDGTPISRKPYTIRLNPDGTPIAERFKKRVLSNNLGNATYVSPSQSSLAGLSSQPAPQSHPETLDAHMGGEADALGEVDTEMTDLARHVVFAGAQPSSSQPIPGDKVRKIIDPVRKEKLRQAAVKRWQKFREEREALGLSPRGRSLAEAAKAAQSDSATGTSGQPVATGSDTPSGSASTSAVKKRGGFTVPGAAQVAAHKRWALFNADEYAGRSGRQSTPAEQAYRDAMRSGSVKPISASPRRVISLSGGGGPPSSSASQTGTPIRRLPVAVARERAGSMRPRSSLPLFLTPMLKRFPSPPRSEYDEGDVIDPAGIPDDMADDDFEPGQEDENGGHEPDEYEEEEEAPQPRTTRGSAGRVQFSPIVRTRSRQAPRSSLPSRLTRTPMPTRAVKGKDKSMTRPRAGSLDDPSPRSILTRHARARAAAPPSSSQGSTSHVTRTASAMPARSLRSGSVANPTARSARPRHSLPSYSQGRSRLVPEIEIVQPKPKAVSVSPVKLQPRPRPRPQYVPTQTRVVMKPKPRPGPAFRSQPKLKSKPKPIVKRRTIRVPRVVIPIGRAARARLVNAGVYNPFYDDDSEEETTIKRHGHAGLRRIALSVARTSRPSEPEPVPQRFVLRAGPVLPEPFKSILDPETITKRANEHECRWKGCAAQMASEWHLVRHFELREHAAQGAFQSGAYGETTLYRCHWVECEKPCFASMADLEQHMSARHISKSIPCPWYKCDFTFGNISHLTRHALRHHDEPADRPRPLTDMSGSGWQPELRGDLVLPKTVAVHTLITPPVPSSTYNSVYRREWCALKVRNGSMAPPNPVLVPDHPPHMLAAVLEPEAIDSDNDSVYTMLNGGTITEERLLDEAAGRYKRRLIPIVDVTVRKRAKAGTYQDLFQSGGTQDEPINFDVNDDEVVQPQDDSEPPRLRARFDLSESVHPDDQRDDGESGGSESEVWAELEDDLANTAMTPAGFPADFDLAQLDDDHGDDGQPGAEQDEIDFEAIAAESFGEPATPAEAYSTPAAYLGFDDPDDLDEDGPVNSTSSAMDVDNAENEDEEEPVWPEDVDLERELGGMLDADMVNVDSTATTENPSASASASALEEEAPQADDGMEVDQSPGPSADIDETATTSESPGEPEADNVEEGAPPGEATAPDADKDVVEITETVIENVESATVGPNISEPVPDVPASAEEEGVSSRTSVEKEASVQPDKPDEHDEIETDKAVKTVPDFAALFGKSPAAKTQSQEDRVDHDNLTDVPTTIAQPSVTTVVEEDVDPEVEVERDDSAVPTDTATSPQLAKPTPEDEHATTEEIATDMVPEQEQGEQEQETQEVLDGSMPDTATVEPPVEVTVVETTSVNVQETNTVVEEQQQPPSLGVDIGQPSNSEVQEPSTANDDDDEGPPPVADDVVESGAPTLAVVDGTAEETTATTTTIESIQVVEPADATPSPPTDGQSDDTTA